MSLFKTRSWWTTTAGFEEFHDNHSLAIGNIDNSVDGYDKLVVGSYQGLLRIYAPQEGGYIPAHMMLEKQMDPIIQVAIGKFANVSSQLHLAVLHPRLLSVYILGWVQNDQGTQYNLTTVYTLSLERTAFNMTWGPFGGAKGKDLICVQSMDGMLSFFQHDAFIFSCFLPDFLVPGPLGHLPRADSIVTVTSAHVLQSFKYQSFAVAAKTPGAPDASTKKKIAPDFSVNLGEHCVDLAIKTTAKGSSHILALGERTVFCFKENGVLRFARKLDFNPSCLYVYGTAPSSTDEEGSVVQFILATHTNQLLIFKDTHLMWAAHMEHSPAALCVAHLQHLRGVIVCLDDVGHLSCSYLGTDPALFVATLADRELNYEEADREMKALQQAIKDAQKEHSSGSEDGLLLTVEMSSSRPVENEEENEGLRKCLDMKLSLRSRGNTCAKDVSVYITTFLPATAHPTYCHWETIDDATVSKVISVVCVPVLLPVHRNLIVTASYVDHGLHRSTEQHVALPFSLFCTPCQPLKAAEYKITVDTNCPSVNLPDLFPELAFTKPSEGVTLPNAMGFKLLAGPEVTVVSSKSSERYRIQSDHFSAIAPMMDELIGRLGAHWKTRVPPFCARCNDKPPLNEYFEIIDNHYRMRISMEQCREVLKRHAQQFRAIQKRLLTRFKDKTPVGLAHLDTLLEGTFMQIMALADKYEVFQSDLERCSNDLACATKLTLMVIKLSVIMSPEEYRTLEACLNPVVIFDSEQGWEEQTFAAISHLLHTSLAKNPKDHTGPVALELPDVQKLKRNIALLCDRISKGGRLGASGPAPTTAAPPPSTATQSLERKSSTKSQFGKLPPLPENTSEELEDNQISLL